MKMKITVVSGCLLFLTCACFAQDVIVTKDAKKINAKVMEVDVNDIKYKDFDNMDGPTHTLLKSAITVIMYQNGQIETFETENTTATNPLMVRQTLSRMKQDDLMLYKQYQKGRRQSISGMTTIAIGGVACLLGTMVMGNAREVKEEMIVGTYCFIIGGACFGLGVPLVILGGKNRNESLNNYRQKYTSTQPTPHIQLNLHGNGIGLAYVF